MTTPLKVLLWGYAPLTESADDVPVPPTARYLLDELLPDPRPVLYLEAEGVEFGPNDEVHHPPLHERVARLRACALEGLDHQSERCLAHLAMLDRSAAVEIAQTWSQAVLTDAARPLVTALLKFPTPGTAEAYLDGLGLTDQHGLEPAGHKERPITLAELLLERGRAHLFPLHRRQHAVRPDTLLRELASLAPGVLDGLHLEQLPSAGDLPPRSLVARGGGRRYEAPARGRFALDSLGDFIDPVALLDFLNALALLRASEVRWVLFETDGNTCVVAAGPGPAFTSLQAEGLIPLSAPERLRTLEALYGQ